MEITMNSAREIFAGFASEMPFASLAGVLKSTRSRPTQKSKVLVLDGQARSTALCKKLERQCQNRRTSRRPAIAERTGFKVYVIHLADQRSDGSPAPAA